MEQIHGGDIYSKEYRLDFSANLNPLGMPEAVRRAACEGVELSVHYPDVLCRRLRGAISDAYGADPDHVICGNGAAELIFALAQAQRPGKALLVSPGFAEYELALKSVECETEFYNCTRETGFVIQEDFADLISEDIDLLFLCNPANPTGVLVPKELLEKIALRCAEKKVLLVLDECFNGFLDDPDRASLLDKVPKNRHLFILRAFTKLYAMAGLRLGYGICSDRQLLEKMHSVLQPWNVSLPAQRAGYAAISQTGYVEESRKYVRNERNFLRASLEKLGLTCYDSAANFLFFEGPEMLAQQCEKQGILIRDCSNYRGLKKGYFRIAVRKREENEELLRVLKEILDEGQKR